MIGFDLQSKLAAREAAGLNRKVHTFDGRCDPNVQTNGQDYLSFCSNDYLGLANDQRVIEAFTNAAKQYGVGSGASHLVSGHHKLHRQLEEALADWLGVQKTMLFSTGYMANLGVVNGLTERGDLVLEDKWNHASLIDGGLSSEGDFKRYLHNDMASLESLLQKNSDKRKLIVSDGVFSMDGDVLHLPRALALSKQYQAPLMIDDAHGFGVLGKQGRGVAEHFEMDSKDIAISVGTFGKAFGTSGAFVAGSEELIEYLTQFARTYIYTTAMPPAVAAATLESLRIIQAEPERRDILNSHIKKFRQGIEEISDKFDIELMESPTPIQPLVIGDVDRAMKLANKLKQQGLWITAIRPPTVPKGTARLRITFSANHSQDQVNLLLEGLTGALEQIQ